MCKFLGGDRLPGGSAATEVSHRTDPVDDRVGEGEMGIETRKFRVEETDNVRRRGWSKCCVAGEVSK